MSPASTTTDPLAVDLDEPSVVPAPFLGSGSGGGTSTPPAAVAAAAPDPAPDPKPLRMLTRDEVLEADDRATEVVEVPEWGGALTVRALSGIERDQWEAGKVSWERTKGNGLRPGRIDFGNVTAQLVAQTVIGEDGLNMFSTKDVLILGQKSAAALDRVAKVAQRLSGITEADVEDLKDDLGKDPSDASSSG